MLDIFPSPQQKEREENKQTLTPGSITRSSLWAEAAVFFFVKNQSDARRYTDKTDSILTLSHTEADWTMKKERTARAQT